MELSNVSAHQGQAGGDLLMPASVTRTATLSPKSRVGLESVEVEILGSRRLWSGQADQNGGLLAEILSREALSEIDRFDHVQLAETIRVFRNSRSLSEAGRMLFTASHARRSKANDADRLRKYLGRFALDWAAGCRSDDCLRDISATSPERSRDHGAFPNGRRCAVKYRKPYCGEQYRHDGTHTLFIR